jgi:Ca-activated chloride channel family protein
MEQKARIHSAIEDLSAGGSTAMASGIELAYQEAMKTLDGGSLSRIVILSDGDANVGTTSHAEILKRIRGHVKEGVTVTTVGFGMGNYQDTMMEQLADQGNGNHYYVDSLLAARRIFQEQLGGTLEVIAQDVKLQVEFDPAREPGHRGPRLPQ